MRRKRKARTDWHRDIVLPNGRILDAELYHLNSGKSGNYAVYLTEPGLTTDDVEDARQRLQRDPLWPRILQVDRNPGKVGH